MLHVFGKMEGNSATMVYANPRRASRNGISRRGKKFTEVVKAVSDA